ncbi:arginase family protein [Aidingimonas halophila]|uniref:Arginase n=1 Tax=Aidingimonas halophila TaxID=574349 RepID=A0A1H2V084_9GAMM|nr:arginase family protein [Aidingimonas halophila]SDW61304.1 arginase [Aidingimonas halophila]
MTMDLLLFHSPTADRNTLGMEGASRLAEVLSDRISVAPIHIGESGPLLHGDWHRQLMNTRPVLRQLGNTLSDTLDHDRFPITVLPRCAAALGTLPVIARHHPDAILLWLDAHGDLNTPRNSESGYLGGMVVSAAAGQWNSGLGTGWSLDNIILAGARALDPCERQLIDAGAPKHVPPGTDFVERLLAMLGDVACYIHLDCDVLEPGHVPTEYACPGGITLETLSTLFRHLSRNQQILGIQVAEFESRRQETSPLFDPSPLASTLLAACPIHRGTGP